MSAFLCSRWIWRAVSWGAFGECGVGLGEVGHTLSFLEMGMLGDWKVDGNGGVVVE